MLALRMITWWYSAGWKLFLTRLGDRMGGLLDFFSIPNLLRTLFSPFHQISAGNINAKALDARLRAWGDKQFSRIIGFFVRFGIIIFGSVAIILNAIISLILIILWPIIPLLPIACVVLTIIGFVPPLLNLPKVPFL